MKSSELIELLASLKPTLPVRVRDGSEMLFIGQVYHEPLNTFIQGAAIEGKYSTVQALLGVWGAMEPKTNVSVYHRRSVPSSHALASTLQLHKSASRCISDSS